MMDLPPFREDFIGLENLWQSQPPRLFRINPHKCHRFFNDRRTTKDNKVWRVIQGRVSSREYRRITQSLQCMIRYSQRLFPAFICMLDEFVNEEWLSLIDIGHKAFHRDHIVHQPQVALVLKRLFDEVRFDPSNNIYAARMYDCFYSDFPYRYWRKSGCGKPLISLLDITAFMLAEGSRELDYLYHFAESLGIPRESLMIDGKTSRYNLKKFMIWRQIAYNAGITAALYHDIGYPVQFLSTLEKAVNHSSFGNLLANLNAGGVSRYFDSNLCLIPFKAYSYGGSFPFPHNVYSDYEQGLGEALRDTHGLPGALTFLYLNNEVREFEMHRENLYGLLTMEIAALAIVMHDMLKIYGSAAQVKTKKGICTYTMSSKRPYMRLSFSKDPLSFLLTLADQIQAYGRANSIFDVMDFCRTSDAVLMQMEERITETRIRWDPEELSLKITYCFGKQSPLARVQQVREFNPKTEAEYYDPFTGYLDYSDLFSKVALGVE